MGFYIFNGTDSILKFIDVEDNVQFETNEPIPDNYIPQIGSTIYILKNGCGYDFEVIHVHAQVDAWNRFNVVVFVKKTNVYNFINKTNKKSLFARLFKRKK